MAHEQDRNTQEKQRASVDGDWVSSARRATSGLPPSANTSDPSAPFYIDIGGLDFSTTPPTRDRFHTAYPPATVLPDGALPPDGAIGNFIVGPTHPRAPETVERPETPKGEIFTRTISSTDGSIYTPGWYREESSLNGALAQAVAVDGAPSHLILTASRAAVWEREVRTYVPAQLPKNGPAPFIVVNDGDFLGRATGLQANQTSLITVLDNLIADRRIPPICAVMIDSGGQDAQGSQRGREYDTVSGVYAQWVDTEILPLAEEMSGVKFTRDPNGRATMGMSSSGVAAFTMAWFRPDLFRRVLSYCPTLVNQQWPHDPALPGGAWEYHSPWPGPKAQSMATLGLLKKPVETNAPTGSPLIANSPRKPIRFWFVVGDRDGFYPSSLMPDGMHDWVLSNANMAKALAAKGYEYQYIFAQNADHGDPHLTAQMLPAALEWIWAGYPAPVE